MQQATAHEKARQIEAKHLIWRAYFGCGGAQPTILAVG